MPPVRKKVEVDGKIALEEALTMAKIQPGDWVLITPAKNKIVIQVTKQKKPKGAVAAAAGILKDCDALVEEMLRIREGEDDRPGTTI